MQLEQRPDVRFEATDISTRAVIGIGVGLLVVVALLVCVLYLPYSYLRHRAMVQSPPPLPATEQGIVPPEPRLQESPPRDLSALRAEWEFELQHYGWIDQAHGVVRIPIAQAIDTVAKKGIPVQKSDPSLFFQPRAGDPLTGFESFSETGTQ